MEPLTALYTTRLSETLTVNTSHKTTEDLEIDDSFEQIDFTRTTIGKQYLYHRLRNPSSCEKDPAAIEEKLAYLSSREKLIQLFDNDSTELYTDNSWYLPDIIFHKGLQLKWYQRNAWIFQIASGLLIILSCFYKPTTLILLPLMFLNICFHFMNKPHIFLYQRTFAPIAALYSFVKRIRQEDEQHIFYTRQHHESAIRLLPLFKSLQYTRILNFFSTSDLYVIPWLFIELIKGITLLEISITTHIIRQANNRQPDLHNQFQCVGETDSMLSILTLRKHYSWCLPTIDPVNQQQLVIEQIYHPSIPNCVKNNISTKNPYLLITGSNASGKTTFLRTVGFNALTAQCLNTCFAQKFQLPVLTIATAIQSADNAQEGVSYYMSEVNNIGSIITISSSQKCLILIDEIFKGTNNLERIAIAKATLSFLRSHQHFVFCTTHDFELVELLKNDFDIYNFTEQVVNDQMEFDFIIRQGIARTRNAIRILKAKQFPVSLTAEADAVFNNLVSKQTEINNR